ncbi:Response regulator receiver domain-containing protein [Sphingomonas sp. NFR15]|nr:Response regulator receiver domain-containing protein [Sphingomonas sp. NFR15]
MPPPLRVAVIDDDEELRFALADLLTSLSHVVGCFADGPSYLEAHADFRPDVIISDFHMPGLTGIEMVRELRARGAETPAILITAYATEATRKASEDAGFLAMLKKPFDTDEFVRVIEATANL